jgi:hypothetical protein
VNAPKIMYNKRLHNLYASSNIIRVISRGITWPKYIAFIEEVTKACKILTGKPQDSTILGRMILRRNSEK